jgi:hypothetical protein
MMRAAELYAVLDRAGVDFEVVESFEGVLILRVPVEDESPKPLSECTDADIIAAAAAEGYELTPEDCAEIRASSKVPGESVRAAIFDFLDSFER